MAHPRKKRRTQAPGKTQNTIANGVTKTNPLDRTPKSMVLRMGASDVGPGITQLVKDVRNVMEPHTATRLKERRSNKLRDYTTMAGPLGVSHLLLFSRSTSGNTNLRIAITPRGPTLNFRIEKYSLCKDVSKSQRHPKSAAGGMEHLTPPLLVMNNFATSSTTETTSIPKHLESLTTSVFQSLFPPISPQRTPLSSIRRVLLLDRTTSTTNDSESATYILNLRHYAITSKSLVPLSRGLKRLRTFEKSSLSRSRKLPTHNASTTTTTTNGITITRIPKSKATLPNLSKLSDVADFLLDPSSAGFTSASESELDTDAEVEVVEPHIKRVLNRRDKQRQRDAFSAQQAAAAAAATATVPEADDDENSTTGTTTTTTRKSRSAAPQPQKRAIRLTELGPRMRLRLVKVEEGVCGGKVMWHEFVRKTEEEERRMEGVWEGRRREREERVRVQKANVERKRRERGAVGGGKKGDDDEGVDAEMDGDGVVEDEEEWDDYDGQARGTEGMEMEVDDDDDEEGGEA